MNVIKITAGSACVFLIVLSLLIVFVENPEKKLYEKTVETVMTHEGLSSSQEVFENFPELKNIKSKMKRMAYLNSCIHNMTEGATSNGSKEESLQLKEFAYESRQIRRFVNKELTQLLDNYPKGQP